jgi:hypothetical protein
MNRKLWGAAAAFAGLLAAGAAQAGPHVSWSVTVGGGGYYPGPVYSPAPQVVAPAPVYVPAPVYYEPAPVVVAPQVVYGPRYVQAPVYVQPPPVYVDRGWRGHGHHRHRWD